MTDQDATKGMPLGFPAFASLPPAGAWLQNHGLVLDEVSGTRVTAHIELNSRHLTPWGVIHGGVYTTAIESVASVGASEAVFELGQFAVERFVSIAESTGSAIVYADYFDVKGGSRSPHPVIEGWTSWSGGEHAEVVAASAASAAASAASAATAVTAVAVTRGLHDRGCDVRCYVL